PSFGERLCRASRACTFVRERAFTGLPDAQTIAATLATRDDPADGELGWLRARYGDIASRARASGARLAVVGFPDATQLDGHATARLDERLIAVGRDAGWSTIDLLPAFRAHRHDAEPLFIDLWHPTAVGYRIAADAVLHALRCDGLLPLAPAPDCTP